MGERLYRIKYGELRDYEVVHRTAKQIRVQRTEHGYRYERTIRSDKTDEYFATPREAWVGEVVNLREQIEQAKYELQQLRSALGTAEKNAK